MSLHASKTNMILAPRPVHPRAVRLHGHFGIPYVRQHMVVDERWTPSSLTEEFKGMTDLLSKELVVTKMGNSSSRKGLVRNYRNLRFQCREGRHKLQMSLQGKSNEQIRRILINHKDMQRLYQKMPLHLVVDNIDQRTFILRKEHDRLMHRYNQLKNEYHHKLLERAALENRIRYENEFVLDEEVQMRLLSKKIEDSRIRLNAIKTINSTYQKMIQILRHDATFYEPMLRSLSLDAEDQGQFIKHILFLGSPAIAEFKKFSEEYRITEEKSRKNFKAKLKWVAEYKDTEKKSHSTKANMSKNPSFDAEEQRKNYVRKTPSMLYLSAALQKIEDTINEVKFATLCPQAREIYPRMKSQADTNRKLHKKIENDTLGHQAVEVKRIRAEVLEGVLINNLSEEETKRLNRIRELQELIRKEDEIEMQTMDHVKNRDNCYVLLRYSLFNLHSILRHVDRSPKVRKSSYVDSYLKLPLLKFEMLNMRAYPPEISEENLNNLMHTLKQKVLRLMRVYIKEITDEQLHKQKDEYHHLFLEMKETGDAGAKAKEKMLPEEEEELDVKIMKNVPNRNMIKAQSAKILEEVAKKDE